MLSTKTYGDSKDGALSEIDILRLGGLLCGGVTLGSAAADGGEIIFAAAIAAGTGGGIPGTAVGMTPGTTGIPGTPAGTTPGTIPPGIIGTVGIPGIPPGCVTMGIPATPVTPGIPAFAGIIADGITGTAPATCCIGGMPTIAEGAILACGTIPGKVPGTIPGTMGTAPAIGAIGTAVGIAAAAIATFVIGCGGISGFTAAATPFRGSMGLRLPAPVGVNVGVVPIELSEAKSVGGNALGTSMPRNFRFISLHAILNSLMFIFPSESVSAKAL